MPTSGTNDTTCSGLLSSSSLSVQTGTSRVAGDGRNIIIVAVCVSLAIIFIFGTGVAWWCRRRRIDLNRRPWDNHEMTAHPYELPFPIVSTDAQDSERSTMPLISGIIGSAEHTSITNPGPSWLATPVPPIYFDYEILQFSESDSLCVAGTPLPPPHSTGFSTTEPPPRDCKLLEARNRVPQSIVGSSLSANASSIDSSAPFHSGRLHTMRPHNGPDLDVERGVLIQHLDGGEGVQEVPPPYVDRTYMKPIPPTLTSAPEYGS